MFLAKKRESELKAKADKERQYLSMFKPQVNAFNPSNNLSTVINESETDQKPEPRTNALYQAGRDRIREMKNLTKEELIRLE